MHYPVKQQHNNNNNDDDASNAWGGSEGVYTKLTVSPTAPDMSDHGHATTSKHVTSLPFAVVVESENYDQAPLTPQRAASAYHGTDAVASPTPPTTCQAKTLLWLYRLPLLLLFHVYNGALGIGGFALVVTLLPLSVGLLPLCCLGVVVFRVATCMTEWLAKVDVALANLTIGAHDVKLRVHKRMGPTRSDASTTVGSSNSDNDTGRTIAKRVLTNLVFVSPRNLGAMVYFATLKFAVGILSIVIAGFAVGLPVCAITFAWGFDNSDIQMFGFTYDDHPAAYVLSAIGATLVSLLLLPAVAALSRQITKIVCAETTDVHQPVDARQPVAVGPNNLV